jgi:hypothetical protein
VVNTRPWGVGLADPWVALTRFVVDSVSLLPVVPAPAFHRTIRGGPRSSSTRVRCTSLPGRCARRGFPDPAVVPTRRIACESCGAPRSRRTPAICGPFSTPSTTSAAERGAFVRREMHGGPGQHRPERGVTEPRTCFDASIAFVIGRVAEVRRIAVVTYSFAVAEPLRRAARQSGHDSRNVVAFFASFSTCAARATCASRAPGELRRVRRAAARLDLERQGRRPAELRRAEQEPVTTARARLRPASAPRLIGRAALRTRTGPDLAAQRRGVDFRRHSAECSGGRYP